MSFTGNGEFVSLGYPWVLAGYEGELQERLYDSVYGFAAGPEYGGKTFAQRFRQQWTAQISFFENHGFVESRREAIYALDLRTAAGDANLIHTGAAISDHSKKTQQPDYRVEVHQGFEWHEFERVAGATLPGPQLAMLNAYCQSVQLDFSISAEKREELIAYAGSTVRADTGFAELNVAGLDKRSVDAITPCVITAVYELRSRNALFLGVKPMQIGGRPSIFERLGFVRVTDELYFSRSL
jgi:hypothetical protein